MAGLAALGTVRQKPSYEAGPPPQPTARPSASGQTAVAGQSGINRDEPTAKGKSRFGSQSGGELITHGPRNRNAIALTFDADMTQGMLKRLNSGEVAGWYDSSIIDQLQADRVPATIFLTGLWAKAYPEVVKSLASNPLFELENHSNDHAFWEPNCFRGGHVSSAAQKTREVELAATSIEDLTGRAPRYFRFPGGCHNSRDLALVGSLNEKAVGWDVVSGDPFQWDPTRIQRAVLGRVRDGSIIVMHLMGPPNAPETSAALRVIIPALQARGFEFVTLSDLLGSSSSQSPVPSEPASPGGSGV
jgi:peptidoglycan/xylan/chitin deacetylase (PgdA/CDA1 family)